MTPGQVLLAATLAVPFAMLLACLSPRLREAMPALLPFAPLPALATALLAADGTTLTLPGALLGLTLALDQPGAMLIGTAALLWIAAGVTARAERFSVWWLMTLAGSLGVFIVADLVGFYLFFTLVSLSAYYLIVHDGTPGARRAGAIYVALAVLAEAFLLMGFVLMAAAVPDGSLLIRDAVAALPASPWRGAVLALLLLGFGIKIGLVPLHVWMPLTYPAAPTPVAAALSGAAVKAGIIGLIRFLPLEAAQPFWGEALVAAGLASAFYGVAIGITQANPRTVLAYSSVSQMGLLAAVLGMGLAAGDKGVAVLAAFYAVHHILVKGGLFLALGVAARTGAPAWPVLLPAAIIALGFGGLPLTGGALAKLAVKAPLGDGLVGTLAILSAIGSTLLMVHFLHRLKAGAPPARQAAAPASLVAPWLAIAFAALVVPYALYPGALAEAFTAKELWAALWPVLVGGLLGLALLRARHLLPNIPAGDVLALGDGALRATRQIGAAMERIDGGLRRFPVAGVTFLALTVALAVTILAAR